MTRTGRVLALAALAAAGAQLVPVARTNPPAVADIGAPAEIASVLRRACYDCHSNETQWPWYSHIAPVSWLLAHDVEEGRQKLNFSAWRRFGPERQARKRAQSIREVRKGKMPPWSYRALHPEARLTRTERNALMAWLESSTTVRP